MSSPSSSVPVVPAAERERTPWLRAIGDAIRGTREDYTDGPVGRALLLLAVPMVLETVMESIFAIVDVFWVARLGPDSVATVGLTESMLFVIYSLAMGLAVGATAMVARRIGEKEYEGAAVAAVQAVALGIAVSAVLGALGAYHAADLLRLMGASEAIVRTGAGYARWMLGGHATVLLLFVMNAVFRGAGDAAIAMRVLWLANAINLVLDPCLIFGLGPFPELGVTGAAVATNIGRGTAVLFQAWRLLAGRERVAVARRHLVIVPAVAVRLVRLSTTATFQGLATSTSWIGLVRILSTFGADVLAGYTVGIRVVIFALLPAWGLANAAATMVGQSLGAGRPERAVEAVRRAGLYNMVVLGAVSFVFLVWAPGVIGLFTADPAVAHAGVLCLRVVSAGFVFYAWGMVLTAAFNGAGDTWTPTWLNFFCFWLWEVPLAWLLSGPLGLGPVGIFAAIAIAFSTLAATSAWMFTRGRWRRMKV
jgi:putative MATE family efflux protein